MDINEPLQHYASPYYDPVKAHEYYMRMMRERKSGLIQKMRFLVRRRKR